MSGVPEGWVEVELGEVVGPKETRNPRTDGSESFRYIDIQAVDNDGNRVSVAPELGSRSAPSRARRLVRRDDVLFCLVRPYLRNIALVPPELDGHVASTAFCVLRPNGAVASRFLFHQVLRDSFIGEVPTYGTSPPSAREDEFLKQRVPLAPLPEQHRIVAKIELLFAKLVEGIAALKRAEANLERYRASVLKAATEGRLTERWRRQNPPEETGEELLRRILAERQMRWETEQLAKFEAKGKKPPKNWKAKYKEPVTPDTSGLPGLPDGWCWATVDQVSVAVQYGSSAKTSPRAEGVPVLRMGNIQQGALDLESLKYLPRDHREFPKLLLADGDLLFNRTNSAELVGKTAVYRGRPDPCSFASYLISVRTVRARLSTVVASALNSSWGRAWIASVVSQQVGQANVNGTKLRAFPFPLPPETEQDEITRLSGDAGESATRLTGATTDLLRKTTVLRQSILKRAFEGRLVPQDPADEPASVLLERIRAEQDAEWKRRKRRRSNRKRQRTSRTT